MERLLPAAFGPRSAPLPATFAGELTVALSPGFFRTTNLLAPVDLACAASQFGLARELADAQCACLPAPADGGALTL